MRTGSYFAVFLLVQVEREKLICTHECGLVFFSFFLLLNYLFYIRFILYLLVSIYGVVYRFFLDYFDLPLFIIFSDRFGITIVDSSNCRWGT